MGALDVGLHFALKEVGNGALYQDMQAMQIMSSAELYYTYLPPYGTSPQQLFLSSCSPGCLEAKEESLQIISQ